MGRVGVVACALLGMGCTSDAAVQQRVLFVGNSYTSANSLGNVYKQVSESLLPGTEVVVDVVSPGGATFADHRGTPGTVAKIEAGAYDYLVVQDQSLFGGFSERLMEDERGRLGLAPQKWSRTSYKVVVDLFAASVLKHNAVLVFYQTWGRRTGDQQYFTSYYGTFKDMQRMLSDGYALYDDNARRRGGLGDTQSRIAPVGEVFEAVYDAAVAGGVADPGLDAATLFHKLYAGDGSHPSVLGTFAAAHTLFATINQERRAEWGAASATHLPAGVGAAEAAQLVAYAWEAAAPVSAALRALQGLYAVSPDWAQYVVRGRKLVMTEVLPGGQPHAVEIDDSGPVPRAQVQAGGAVVDMHSLSSDGIMLAGDVPHILYYKSRFSSRDISIAVETDCGLHMREETCAGYCMWNGTTCSVPCGALNGVLWACQDVSSDNIPGVLSRSMPWKDNNRCTALGYKDCTMNDLCVTDGSSECAVRCADAGESACRADTACVWEQGGCFEDPCVRHALAIDCLTYECDWYEGAAGNGDGLCRSPCPMLATEAACGGDTRCHWEVPFAGQARCRSGAEVPAHCGRWGQSPEFCHTEACDFDKASDECLSMCRRLDGEPGACGAARLTDSVGVVLTCAYNTTSQTCEQKTPVITHRCSELTGERPCHTLGSGCDWDGQACVDKCQIRPADNPFACFVADCAWDPLGNGGNGSCARSVCAMEVTPDACFTLESCHWWYPCVPTYIVTDPPCVAGQVPFTMPTGAETCVTAAWSADTVAPPTEAPPTDTPSTLTPATAMPGTAAPTTMTPAGSTKHPTAAPGSSAPVSESSGPATTVPASSVPATSVPAGTTPQDPTPAPASPAPSTSVPATGAPVTIAPTTTPAPLTTSAPVTIAPSTSTPTTGAPVTIAPTTTPATPPLITPAPVTIAPSTSAPTTGAASTPAPATVAPTTTPATTPLTTPAPVTIAPSTSAPTTGAPVTIAPTTTPAPLTTSAPVTIAPPTSTPTTGAAVTIAPTTTPATTPLITPAPVTIAPSTSAPTTGAASTPAPATVAPTTTPATTPLTTSAPVTIVPATATPAPAGTTPKQPTAAPPTAAPGTTVPATPATSEAPPAGPTAGAVPSVPPTVAPPTRVPHTSAPATGQPAGPRDPDTRTPPSSPVPVGQPDPAAGPAEGAGDNGWHVRWWVWVLAVSALVLLALGAAAFAVMYLRQAAPPLQADDDVDIPLTSVSELHAPPTPGAMHTSV